jgi:N-methylhydantoinase B
MTNTLNTPTEVLEHVYPVRVHRYALRKHSGGSGKFPGGEGIIREIEMLTEAQVGILSDRRNLQPYGLLGGSPGATGQNEMVADGQTRSLPSKCTFRVPAGTVIRIKTPGGGGWGNGDR